RRSRLSGRPVSDAPGSRDARALARVSGGWTGAAARGAGPEDEAMQKLETTFPTDYCNDVMRAVLRVRARCRMTATDVCFADSSTVHKVQYRGAIYELAWQLKTRLEILVADCDADAVRNALVHSLEVEHGVETVISSSTIDDALHVPSGRRGEVALDKPHSVFARLARAVGRKR